MTKTFTDDQLEDALRKLNENKSDNLLELARSVGVDPLEDFEDADLNGCYLAHENLVRANFYAVSMVDGKLHDAQLAGADFSQADLRRADFTRASMVGARFRGASLQGALLIGTDLRNAVLEEADLRGARLDGANLAGASLQSTDLRGAQLRNVQNFTAEQRAVAIIDNSTIVE